MPTVFIQPDSASLSIVLHGDEHFHFYTTLDGIPIVKKNNSYYYADLSVDGLEPSSFLAHNIAERTSDEEQFITRNSVETQKWIISTCRNIVFNSNRERVSRKENRSRGLSKQKTSYIGEKKGLVLLVEFSNKEMMDTSPKELRRMFNENGYDSNGHFGSVRDYFYDQSYGKFSIKFDVIGPIQLEHTFGYYGTNKNSLVGSLVDKYVGRMVVETCKIVDDIVNFADYDWDGDGEVEQVYIIYAGYGEATGGNSTTIWPHEYSLTGCGMTDEQVGPLTLDGVKIDTYACSNELDGGNGKKMMGIGVACHEFSHCLGLPDLYDVNYNGGFGMNVWDVMDAGSHSGPKGRGEVPYGYSAYERWFAGWLDFKEILSTQKISNINCLSEKPEAYIIRNDGWNNEFYILENHQDKGWFQYTGTTTMHHGLMVTHVDFDQDAWAKNRVNAEKSHQRMSIIPADNDFGDFYSFNSKSGFSPSDEDLAGDLFPGIRNVTELSNTSHEDVGGKLFNPNIDGGFFLNKSITNIAENDGAISFDVIYINSVDGIEQICSDSEDDFIIYNIKGQKIIHPNLPGIYICKKNGKCYKKIVNN